MRKLLVVILLFSELAAAQKRINGLIVDSETKEPVAFASIGVVGTSKGTSSNLNGEFSILVTDSISLKITCVGYINEIVQPKEGIVIYLKPGVTRLREVVVFGNELTAEDIVLHAFASIPKNFNPKPFSQKFFYRHYCKDANVYGRLIEAAVEVYKKKGYKELQSAAGQREEMRVVQLRRSFDKTKSSQNHMPIALKNVLQCDLAAYQAKPKGILYNYYVDVSTLRKNIEKYEFTLEGITAYDGQEVFDISYKSREDSVSVVTGFQLSIRQTGKLFITTQTYAFVKYENKKIRQNDTTRTSAYYRQHGNYFYPYHLIRDGRNQIRTDRHWFHIELMSTEVLDHDFVKFKGEEPDREKLANVPFDPVFWDNFDILKTTPLEEEIIADLSDSLSLDQQFRIYQQAEAMGVFNASQSEDRFYAFRDDSRGKRILYLDFWASWCGPCIQEFKHAKKLTEQYKGKITFVMISLDADEQKWKEAISRHGLTDGFVHYRIGERSDVALFYDVNEIPRYVLIDKNGNHFDMNAKRPSEALIKNDFDLLIRGEH